MSIFLFYDTCSLLNAHEAAFETESKFFISSITIKELENIKTSGTKDEETKYNARLLLHLLKENKDKYEIVLYKNSFFEELKQFDLPEIDDNKIISCAYHLYNSDKIDIVFVTDDLNAEATAASLGLKVNLESDELKDKYTGFKVVNFTEAELADFYASFSNESTVSNPFNLLENEYLIVKMNGKVVAKYKWVDNKYIEVLYNKFDSKMFGKIVPYNGDIYQQLAMDSLANNQITMLRGPAGSGKSYLAFGYMFSLLERGKIDKIIIFCNTVATKGSAKLGFYPGSRTEKLLDSQIGNLLESKLGDRIMVEKLIADGDLVLLPMSDIRGYDTTGMNAAIYISEAQNLDIELMRLALQRIGDDSICILDGDSDAQVDLSMYAGKNNGMRRASEVFRGDSIYGEVTLQNIYRGRIAALAQLM